MADQNPPVWNDEQFQATRLALQARFGCSEEEAIERLQALWNGGRASRPPSPPPRSPPPEPAPAQGNRPPANKAPAYVDFDTNATISNQLPSLPSKYALDKIKNFEYVPLWYFTSEGMLEAKTIPPSAPEDTIGLLKTEGGYSLLPVKAAKPSRNADEDEELKWEQIMTAKHNILNAVKTWPEKLKYALATFYLNLEAHKAEAVSTRALVLYQAVVRRQWHAALKGEVASFNISIINKELLAALQNQIRDHDYAALDRKVSAWTWQATSQASAGGYANASNYANASSRERGRPIRQERAPVRVRSSRSRSPTDRPRAPRFRRDSRSPSKAPLSACPICLSRQKHRIRKCQAINLWSGRRKARCSRNRDGNIVDKDGRVLCNNWNQTVGCSEGSSGHIHECSGCGDLSHGAQECGLAEKALPENAPRGG